MSSSALLESLKQKKMCEPFQTVNIIVSRPTDTKIKIIDKKHLDSSINLDAFRKKIINKKTRPYSDVAIFKDEKIKMSVKSSKKNPKKLEVKVEELKDVTKKEEPEKSEKFMFDLKKGTIEPLPEEPDIVVDEKLVKIDGQLLVERLPPKDTIVKIKPSSYYMYNREKFVNFINTIFKPYKAQFKKDKKSVSCEDFSGSRSFSLLTHQELVKDYINVHSPYRGLLLYHGLGAGKTCSSIAIAEGLKTTNQIIIMTPASLQSNYRKELKKCGDPLYRTNQFWEFIQTDGNEHLEKALSKILSLHIEFIKKNNGAWLVNHTKSSNFDKLTIDQKNNLDNQLNRMIGAKYKFINYNGLRNTMLMGYETESVKNGGRKNIFDNKVVIIDEAHNFVSRIVNKIEKKTSSLSMKLYEYLLDAQNCRIVLLTGTPIINYPNEIGILYNILRGYIKSYQFVLDTSKTNKKIDNEKIKSIFAKYGLVDYIDYKPRRGQKLNITRNPYGFLSKVQKKTGDYRGLTLNSRGKLDDNTFKEQIIKILEKNAISVKNKTFKVVKNKALPDKFKKFNELFINPETARLKNKLLFKKRILGLTSYFRSAQESLLPKFNEENDIKIINVPMSDYQLGIYEISRAMERKEELKNAKNRKKNQMGEIYKDTTSTYRIFSRAFCNFVFPDEIVRPLPSQQNKIDDVYKDSKKKKLSINENLLDNIKIKTIDNERNDTISDSSYSDRIYNALSELKENSNKFLTYDALKTYSPKFREIVKRCNDKRRIGIHLIYSQFRTLEGIGILSLILKQNGWAEFKINKTSTGLWKINMNREDLEKPCFALYTGTEEEEEKEIIRNILNSNWDYIPQTIKKQLNENGFINNYVGDVIKCMMITSSGAEGIDLKNVRYVHIVEPYWHPVRKQQVIGRARRICSHKDLPKKLQTVTVYVYITVFSKIQLEGDPNEKDPKKRKTKLSNELFNKDVSKITNNPVTTDEALLEISNRKENINKEILYELKTTAIDCAIFADGRSREKLLCYNFGSNNPNKIASFPNINDDDIDDINKVNIKKMELELEELTIRGKKYFIKRENASEKTGILYDYESAKNGIEVMVGKLIKTEKGKIKKIKV
jgi:hypothetical protein